jgi:hypothetical protein
MHKTPKTSLNNELDYEQMERSNSNAHNKLTTIQPRHREKQQKHSKEKNRKAAEVYLERRHWKPTESETRFHKLTLKRRHKQKQASAQQSGAQTQKRKRSHKQNEAK